MSLFPLILGCFFCCLCFHFVCFNLRDDDIREVTKFHVAFDGDRARVHARSVIFDKDQNASLRSIVAEIELEDEVIKF